MPVVAVVLDGEQAIIGGLCIRQYIPGRGAVHKPLFQQEADKPALRHNQFLGGGTEIGAVLEVNEQVIKGCLALQHGVFLPQRRIFLPFCQQVGTEFHHGFRGSGNLPQLFSGDVGPVLADRGQHLIKHPAFKSFRRGQFAVNDQAV